MIIFTCPILTLKHASFLGISKEQIFLNYRVTEIKWYGADYTDESNSTSVSESGNESDDSGKTVINLSETQRTAKMLTVPNFTEPDEVGVEVKCENGITFRADCAVCTLPLGVLKEQIRTLFVPSLPDYKVESIERLLFGTVNKIFLGYDRPFLNPDVSEVLLLWESNCDTSKTENGKLRIYT